MGIHEYGTGAVLSPKDNRDYKLAGASQASLPSSFFLNSGFMVKDQGATYSCVGQCCSYVAEWFNHQKHRKEGSENQEKETNPYAVYGYRSMCEWQGLGMNVRDALRIMQKVGVPFVDYFSCRGEVPVIILDVEAHKDAIDTYGAENRIQTYFYLNDSDQIKRTLYAGSPVIAVVNWKTGFHLFEKWVASDSGKKVGLHAITLYGWNRYGWQFVNSYGVQYGRLGKAILPYSVKIEEAWGVADMMDESLIDKGA